jgi:uncharacterized membrane protein (DUF373 family)
LKFLHDAFVLARFARHQRVDDVCLKSTNGCEAESRTDQELRDLQRGQAMALQEEFARARGTWRLLTVYEKFEHTVILILTGLIAIIIALAVWNLVLKVFAGIVASGGFDPTDYSIFQALFGMIFTVIIALEFKRSLLVVAERHDSVVQVRTVVLIALLAIVRKLLILDLSTTDALHLFALAAAILALGGVYWLVRDQDSRERASP